MSMQNEDNRHFAGRDTSNEMARLGCIQRALFTRPPNDFDKTGKSGSPIVLVANFVALEQHPDQVVQQCHVEFDPPIESRMMRHTVLKQEAFRSTLEDAFIFDGMALYVPGNSDVEGTYTARHPTTNEEIKVSIHSLSRFNRNEPQSIVCYNIVIKCCMEMLGLKRLGRNHYDEQQKLRLRDYDMEVWPGFETAVRQCEDGLMLCIESRFRMIRTQSVWYTMKDEYERSECNLEAFHAKMEEMFVGQVIFARYNNRMYRVTSIKYDMSPASTFKLSDGSITSLEEYYEKNYNLTIRHKEQPVIVSESKAKKPGEAPFCAYLLPELCFPTGLTEPMRKDWRHMRQLAQYTRLDPEKRRQTTENVLKRILNSDRCQYLLQKWGIELEEKLISFQSRELEPEKLIGLDPRAYVGERAEWSRFIRYHGNYRGVFLRSWVVIAPISAADLAHRFTNEVQRAGESMRIEVASPIIHYCRHTTAASYRSAADEAMKMATGRPIQMMVILLSDDSKTRYDLLKSWLCTEIKIPSQCVRLSTLYRRPQDGGRNKNFPAIILKILLQMNCKMGGALWKVLIPVKRTMFVGYDLYHDSTLRGRTIGACVSTTDQDYTQFFSQTRPHANPTELGTNLGYFIKKALFKYYVNNNRTLPEKIILYRDGLGDGQIPSVREHEVTLVQQACIEMTENSGLDPANHPIKLAFVIVTKKVNLRIFKKAADTTLTNPSPGTVVDSVITRPERYDFYLVPQHVTQGTVTPVCYNVIYDDTGLTPDNHHKIAFKLCHMYYNWQGTVRVPALCQYAHKLAFLVSQSIHRNVSDELCETLFFL